MPSTYHDPRPCSFSCSVFRVDTTPHHTTPRYIVYSAAALLYLRHSAPEVDDFSLAEMQVPGPGSIDSRMKAVHCLCNVQRSNHECLRHYVS